MGTDIHGIVECHGPAHAAPEARSWQFAMDLRFLSVSRNYDAFGCLFGVRNDAGFRPVAAGRGFPKDAAAATRETYDAFRSRYYPHWTEGQHHASWLTWHDVTLVNWDEQARHPEWIEGYDSSDRGEAKRRRDVIGTQHGWHDVFEVMRIFADLYGNEGVRIVVWFDG